MKWPNHADYAEVIQYPEASFSDPTLQKSFPSTNSLGLPIALSGNFASVYELSTESEAFAVRCFVRQVTNQKTRYAKLDNYCSKLDLPFMVPFEYISRGIRVNEDWYPIVKMDWVRGEPIETHIEKHLNQSAKIELLSIEWRELVRTLEEHEIGHGDLQHGNLLVTHDGQFKLVDYDGMFIPAFAGEKSPELGHPNYQHPLRTPDFYDERLDHFAALLIYLSLKAVSADPALWKEFHTGDNLIISSSDMRVPQSSKLWPRLLESPDDEVQKLTVFITDFLKVPPMNVPDLETILESSIQGIVVPNELELIGTHDQTSLTEQVATLSPQPISTEEVMAPSISVRAFEVAGWSAFIFAILAILPPFRILGGAGAALLAIVSFLLPGKRAHHNRAIAMLALMIGTARMAHQPQIEAAARDTNPINIPAQMASATPTSNDSLTTSIVDESLSRQEHRDRVEALIRPTNPLPIPVEPQSVSLPTSEPAERSIVRPLMVWDGHQQPISSIAFTGDGNHIVTSSSDRVLSIWKALDQKLLHSIANLSEPIVSIATLTNAGIFATASQSANLEWWSIDGGIPLKQIRFNEHSLFPPSISDDGHCIAIGGEDRRSISLHRDGSPQISTTISGFSSWVKHVEFLDDNERVAVLSYDDTISLREIETGKILQTFHYPDADVQEIAWSRDGSWIAAIGSKGRIRAWNCQSGNVSVNATLQTSGLAHAQFSKDGQWIIIATGLGEFHCVRSSNGLIRTPLLPEANPFTSMSLSPDGIWLATGDNRGRVAVWKTSELLRDNVIRMARP